MKNLTNYHDSGKFNLLKSEDLKLVCNAPNDKAGIYLIYDSTKLRTLIYVGCCGHIKNNGEISIRKAGRGGICGRIVNGHQFGKVERWKSIPLQMEIENISKLEFEWYVTFNSAIKHSPIFVESLILQDYFEKNRSLPRWNQKF